MHFVRIDSRCQQASKRTEHHALCITERPGLAGRPIYKTRKSSMRSEVATANVEPIFSISNRICRSPQIPETPVFPRNRGLFRFRPETGTNESHLQELARERDWPAAILALHYSNRVTGSGVCRSSATRKRKPLRLHWSDDRPGEGTGADMILARQASDHALNQEPTMRQVGYLNVRIGSRVVTRLIGENQRTRATFRVLEPTGVTRRTRYWPEAAARPARSRPVQVTACSPAENRRPATWATFRPVRSKTRPGISTAATRRNTPRP